MRRPGALAAVLATLAVVVLAPGGDHAAGSVRAADPDDEPVRITVTELSPLVPAADADLVLAGQVLNTGEDPLTGVTVQLRLSTVAVGGRDELAAVADSTDRPPGGVLADYVVQVSERLSPGQEAQWRISVPGARLGLDGFGVYPLAVECRAALPSGERDRVGTVRTFLPWTDDAAGVRPTRVVTLWPVLAPPSRGADGAATPTAGAAERADLLGRLDRVVQGGDGAAVTWVVDGDQLESAAAIADGAPVAGEPAGVRADPDPDAQAWLTRLTEAVRDADVVAVGYADPDAVAVTRAGLAASLDTAAALGPAVASEVLDRPVGGDLAWPDEGTADTATLGTLAGTGAAAVVLSDRFSPTVRTVSYTPDAVGPLTGTDLTAVVGDARLSRLLARDPDAQGGPVVARQRYLSELAVVTAERPSDGRSVVVVPPRYVDPDPAYLRDLFAAVAAVPWAEPVTLQQLRADAAAGPARRQPSYPASVRGREVAATQLATVTAGRRALTQLTGVLTEPQPLVDGYERALLRGESSAWRTRRTEGAAFAAEVTAAIQAARDSVAIVATGQVTLAARSGLIPVTVVNGLPQAVTVRVGVTAIPAVRLSVTPPPPVTVAAGRRQSVEVPAEATAVGRVDVEARLLTPDGAPYGPPVTIPVQVTGLGRVAAVIVGAALALLAVAFAVRLGRAVRRGRQRTAP
ncbi:MAG: DUF6049 family protein [Actinomycetia bacterium]|nr:DUF6049 family protein [Actinomycetes bacterium]